jgi:hypothetical protein
MKRSGRVAVLLATGVAVLLTTAGRANAYVYWTNTGNDTIGRANLDGTGVLQGIIAGLNDEYALGVDSGHIYWTAMGASSTIGRANLDATGVNPSFIPANSPAGVAADSAYVYWSNLGTGTIGRANLDGSSPTQSFISTNGSPVGVAVDASRIYWTRYSAATIARAAINGTAPQPSFITGASAPADVAVDAAHVYWSNYSNGTIGRADLDGNNVDQSFISGGLGQPGGIDVDGSHIYWADGFKQTIGRANLDGTGVNPSLITGASQPFGLAVDGLGPPPASSSPSNQFMIGKPKRHKRKGTATIPVTVPGPGSLVLSGKGVKPQRPLRAAHARAAKTVTAAGTVKLKIVPRGKAKRKLRRIGTAKVRINVTFTPTGGSPSAQSKKIKLIRRIR